MRVHMLEANSKTESNRNDEEKISLADNFQINC